MNLYRIQASVAYWVSAHNPAEALNVARDTESEVNGSCEEMDDSKSVRIESISKERALDIRVHDDGESTNAWEAHLQSAEPMVIGCSEWP